MSMTCLAGFNNAILGDEESHLPQLIIVGALLDAMAVEQHAMIAAIGYEAKESAEAFMALIELVYGFCRFHKLLLMSS